MSKFIGYVATKGVQYFRVYVPIPREGAASEKRKFSSRYFNINTLGEEKALKEALEYRDRLGVELWGAERWEQLISSRLLHLEVSRSKINPDYPGVHRSRNSWAASFCVVDPTRERGYRTVCRKFGIAVHGEEKAKELARQAREEGIRKYALDRKALLGGDRYA